MAKAKKKNTPQVAISREENVQVQQVLEQYHQLAGKLHASSERGQVEAALTEVNALPEGIQLALVKELSKEKHIDAADVLSAINELSVLKSVRKEARRSLIQLEASRIYPAWQIPVDRTPALSIPFAATNPRRFWKGLVTDSMDIGEVQLLLCWEQGNAYRDVCVLGFLLDYSFAGVKDFFTRVESKRSFEKFVHQLIEEMPDVEFKGCSLAKGHRFLLDALAVNKQRGTTPYKDYRFNLSLINELILEAPDLADEQEEQEVEDEEGIDLSKLNPDEIIMEFVELWADQDYRTAYDFLSQDSPLRAGLTKDEWVELREDWAAKLEPADLKPDFALERTPQKPKIWLPTLFQTPASPNRSEVEAAWSIELAEIPLISTLPELSEPTTIYEETGRHWFWLHYTLVRENGIWHIQSISDEGANAQKLSSDALQKHIRDIDEQLTKNAQARTPEEVMQLGEEEAIQIVEEALLLIMRATYYNDICIKKMPLDRSNYEAGAGRMLLTGQYERCLSYLIPLVERFTEERAWNYRQIGEIYQRLSEKYMDSDDEERSERCTELAESALRESLSIEDSFEAHISLAELLIGRDDDTLADGAEAHLLQAKALATEEDQEAHIELHLGEVATIREQYQEALLHYQRVVDLRPTSADGWADLGNTHKELENFAEAETSYRRAIELEPDADEYYYKLSKLYEDDNQFERATEVLEEGLRANPDSLPLHLYAATNALEIEDYEQAKAFIDEAARLDPDSEAVALLRQVSKMKEDLIRTRELKQQPTNRLLAPRLKQKYKKRR